MNPNLDLAIIQPGGREAVVDLCRELVVDGDNLDLGRAFSTPTTVSALSAARPYLLPPEVFSRPRIEIHRRSFEEIGGGIQQILAEFLTAASCVTLRPCAPLTAKGKGALPREPQTSRVPRAGTEE